MQFPIRATNSQLFNFPLSCLISHTAGAAQRKIGFFQGPNIKCWGGGGGGGQNFKGVGGGGRGEGGGGRGGGGGGGVGVWAVGGGGGGAGGPLPKWVGGDPLPLPPSPLFGRRHGL